MPTPEHEALVALLENEPDLGVEVLRWFKRPVPEHVGVRSVTAALTEQTSRGYMADVVLLLTDADERATLALVFEIQRGRKRRKRYTWPLY